MKKILYTVCSANHLAHCKTMADSFVWFNEEYTVIIGLVDKVNGRFDINDFAPHQLIEVHTIGIMGFEQMASQYTVIELNCAMKPFMAQAIFAGYQPDILLYLDSDIWVQHAFTEVEAALIENDILLTPHFSTPLPDATKLTTERDMLRSGIFNAGFLALKNSDNAKAFLTWWVGHLQTECYYNFAEGMGVDQIWLNLVPLFFDKVGILHNKGANVAYWNLHERKLSVVDAVVMVNETVPLLFLHISGYRFTEPEILSRHQNRFDLKGLPVLAGLLAQYTKEVIRNGYEKYAVLPSVFSTSVKQTTGIMRTINKWLKPLGIKITDI